MRRKEGGFSLVEVMVAIIIGAIIMVATYAVVAAVIKGDEASRIRLQMQLDATTALRKISDLLKMAGPTGNVSVGLGANDYPVFAIDQTGGGFTGNNTFLNQTTYQIPPSGQPNQINNDGVAHLAPTTDTDGYYGTSNEIAFKLPRPTPWYASSDPNAVGKPQNPLDNTGVPVDLSGNTTWGVSANLYSYYSGTYPATVYTSPAGAGSSLADRQTDVYAIVLVPTTGTAKDPYGNLVAGPNQLELREFSTAPNRFLIRKTLLAMGVERITFTGPAASPYYLTGTDPLSGTAFQDASLGSNQLRVSIWMWRNDINKSSTAAISAYRVKQSITVNLRSVGQNQTTN